MFCVKTNFDKNMRQVLYKYFIIYFRSVIVSLNNTQSNGFYELHVLEHNQIFSIRELGI